MLYIIDQGSKKYKPVVAIRWLISHISMSVGAQYKRFDALPSEKWKYRRLCVYGCINRTSREDRRCYLSCSWSLPAGAKYPSFNTCAYPTKYYAQIIRVFYKVILDSASRK